MKRLLMTANSRQVRVDVFDSTCRVRYMYIYGYMRTNVTSPPTVPSFTVGRHVSLQRLTAPYSALQHRTAAMRLLLHNKRGGSRLYQRITTCTDTCRVRLQHKGGKKRHPKHHPNTSTTRELQPTGHQNHSSASEIVPLSRQASFPGPYHLGYLLQTCRH